jgi:imidazolonepropionase
MGLLLTHIHRLYQVCADGSRWRCGAEMQDAACLDDAYLYAEAGRIAALGPMVELRREQFSIEEEISCQGRLVLPGFVDSHTHLVFPATREQEFVMRLRGKSYEEIARAGGGILNSARRLEQVSDEELLRDALGRADEILRTGTTSVEIKSGYGLSLQGELRLLRTARQVGRLSPLRVRTTFLGAHALPEAYRQRRQDYIDLVCQEMLPAVAAESLADHIDVFCDEGFFTPAETEQILDAGAAWGLPGKIHANELAFSGGVQAGVRKGCWSVDHLERSGPEEIQALQGSETVPTLLPSVAFFLGIPYPPARAMMEAGLGPALASDYNPGSSPGGSMPFVLSLACLQMRMSPEEALCAATINGAFALRMSESVGSLEVGKWADLILTKPARELALLPYFYAQPLIERVFIGGKAVFQA